MALQYDLHVNEDLSQPPWKSTRLLIIVILIVVVGISTLMVVSYYMNNRSFNSYKIESEAERSDSNNVNYTYYNGNILKYSRSGINTIDNTGKSLQNGGFEMKQPQIDICGTYIVIADITGKQFYIYNGRDEGTRIETNLPIVRAKVSRQGKVAVLLQDSDSNVLNIYDPYNNTRNLLVEIPTNVSEEGYPLDFDISSDGLSVTIAYMISDGSTIENKVNFYNFTEVGQDRNTLVGGKTFGEHMVGKVEFTETDEAVIFHEKGVTIFGNMKQPAEIAELTFDDTIFSMAMNEKYLAAVTGNAEEDEKTLHLYDLKGKEKIQRTISYDYTDMQLYDEEIIFLTNHSCHILRTNGHEKFNYEFKQEIDTLFPSMTKGVYTLINKDTIQKITLTKG